MLLLSGSALQRLAACLGSAYLPRAERITAPAEVGNGKHDFLRNLNHMSRDEALAQVPDEYRSICEAVNVARLPIGSNFLCEMALAYDFETGATRLLGFDLSRNYGPLGETEIPMTLDVAADASTYVWVGDYKTGHAFVPPPMRNWQLRVGALAFARYSKKDTARISLIHVREDGYPYRDHATLDAFELDLIEAQVRQLGRRVHAARKAAEQGEQPSLVAGEHCIHCPSRVYCPAQIALVRRLGEEPTTVASEVTAELTPATAARAYLRLKLVRKIFDDLEEALKAYAKENPIDLGDGRIYGPEKRVYDHLDASVVRQVLLEQHGVETADKACEYTTSKDAVERAIRPIYESRKQAGEKKVTISGLKEAALKAVRERKGISPRRRVEVREHKARGKLPGAGNG